MKAPAILLLTAFTALAETHTMTLRQALDLALEQNPDIVLARLDQQRARAQVTITRDPFSPHMGVGSGLAWTYGFPASIDGNAPAIFQARGNMALFNQPLKYRAAAAGESARGAEIDVDLRRDDVAYRVYAAFLDAEQAARGLDAARRQIESLERVAELTKLRVDEGRALEIEARRARVDAVEARKSLSDFEALQTIAELTLAEILGYPPGDQVRPAGEERAQLVVPMNEQESVETALKESREVRRLESNLQAKTLEVKSYQAERLPKVDLIWQYSLLSRFNNFDVFYPRFQRNNAQVGASIQMPLLVGRAVGAYRSQAEADIEKIRVEINRTRGRLAGDIRRGYAEMKRAMDGRDLAREQLDLAREQTSLDLIEYEEGRILMAQVEAARAIEQARWIQYYEAQKMLEVARLSILRQTGTLLALLQ